MRSKIVAVGVGVTILVIGIGMGMSLNKQKPILYEDEFIEALPEKPTKNIESYYPVAKDSVWTYELKDDTMTVSVDYIKDHVFQLRYQTEDETILRVYVKEDDCIYEVATIKDSFIKKDYTLLRQYKDCVLRLPLQEGESWALKDGATREIIALDKEIYTSQGKFKTMQVVTEHEDYEMVQYYAEKVGLVKSVYKSSDGKVVQELQSYQTNQPLKVYVDAYYPSLGLDSVVLRRQQISIMTNEEPRHFLTDVLSLEPTPQTIQPLPLETQINAIYVDEDKAIVQVDLSHTYEENSYTEQEKTAALLSVAKTIGNYYKVSQVLITVNGVHYTDVIDVRG